VEIEHDPGEVPTAGSEAEEREQGEAEHPEEIDPGALFPLGHSPEEVLTLGDEQEDDEEEHHNEDAEPAGLQNLSKILEPLPGAPESREQETG
jgi:hypothetical protein